MDLNFPPSLALALCAAGVDAVHWSSVGAATAPDSEILEWARATGSVLLTKDLDFPVMLAATGVSAPSVLLVREADAMGPDLLGTLLAALRQCRAALRDGAIVVLDARGRRVRVLPIQ